MKPASLMIMLMLAAGRGSPQYRPVGFDRVGVPFQSPPAEGRASRGGSARHAAQDQLDPRHDSEAAHDVGVAAPNGRATESLEPGRVVAVPMVVGLHHRYERKAA